jgi:hypothetical protein
MPLDVWMLGLLVVVALVSVAYSAGLKELP